MFTLIRNYKTLLMMCVANSLEGAANAFDIDGNRDISREEYEALLASPEARAIEETTQLDALEAAVDVTQEIITEPVTCDRRNASIEQKTIQFLTTKILSLRGETVRDSSLDGRLGTNSIADIRAVLGDSFNGTEVTLNNITQLQSIARDLVSERRNAREATETEARTLLAGYNTIDEVRALTRDEIRAVQEALNTLGYNVGTADGIAGNRTETGFDAYVAERNEAGEDAAVVAAQAEIDDAESVEYDAAQGVASAERAVEAQRALISSLEEDLAAAQAALTLSETDAARITAAETALVTARQAVNDAGTVEDAEEALRLAQEAIDQANGAVTAAEIALATAETSAARIAGVEAELAAAQEALRDIGFDIEDLEEGHDMAATRLGNAESALAAAQEAAEMYRVAAARQEFLDLISEHAHLAIDQAFGDLGMAGVDTSAPVFVSNGKLWIDRTWTTGNYEIPVDFDAEYVRELGFDNLDALASFVTGKLDSSGAIIGADLTEGLENPDVAAAEAELAAAREAARDIGFDLEDLGDGHDMALARIRAAEAALAAAQAQSSGLSVADAQAALAAARDAIPADTTVTDAEAALAAARQAALDLVNAQAALDAVNAQSSGVDVATAQAAVDAAEQALADARAELGVREMQVETAGMRLDEAEDGVEAARNAELDAYINNLTNSGANEALVRLIEENDGARDMIDRLRNMPPNRIQALGNALAYFGVSTDFAGLESATGDMVVAIIEFVLSENMGISEMTAEYVIQLSEAYQAKADELGEIITGLNTRGYLDTGRTAAENYFNTTTGYPDFEYVTQEGVFSISNGLRGRPRCHTHTTYTTTDTYLTENYHRVTQDGDGETIRSTHSSERNQIGSVTVSGSQTRRWFEMYPGGMEREQISAMIASGEATLRPSYQMLSRLYEPQINGSSIELVEQSWYAEMTEWSRQLEQREGGEMSIVNEDVSIESKMMGSVISEVQREAPDRYAEIQTEVRDEILGSQEFSFLIWDAERGERATALQLVGRQVEGGWTLAMFNPMTGEVVGDVQNFASGDEMLASDLGQQAMMMSTYRYFGVVTNTTEGGLRFVDDQGLIRCGDHERVVLLDEPAPVLPQGYNFLRNGLPCGVLGAYCTSSSNHTTNIRELETDEWTYNEQTREDTDEDSDEDSPEDSPEGTGEDTSTDPGVEGGGDVGGGGNGGTGGNGRT